MNSGVQEIPNFAHCLSPATPRPIKEQIENSLNKGRKTLIGVYAIDQGEQIILSIDLKSTVNSDFSTTSVKTFEAFLKLAGKYQSLIQQKIALENINESLVYSYEEILTLSEKIRHLLVLSQQFGNEHCTLTTFFNQLLSVLLKVIDQANYGSIAFIQGDALTFMAASGHNLQKLQGKKLKKQWFLLEEHKNLIEITNIHALWKAKMPEDVYTCIDKVFLKTQSTLLFTIPVEENLSLLIMIDIAEGKPPNFTQLSRRMCLSFAELARSFVRIHIHTDIMKQAYYNFTLNLSRVLDRYDTEMAHHNHRVSLLAGYLAQKAGLPSKRCEEITYFSALHDIGKIFIDPDLLKKQGPLTAQEFEVIKQHTVLSAQLLEGPFFEVARNIAMFHHERWDGKGYPQGLQKDQIPIEAQIVALADVYDALRTPRNYKKTYSAPMALTILIKGDAKSPPGQFNPALLDILIKNDQDIEQRFYAPAKDSAKDSSEVLEKAP
jgi:HD-GYP domain-containing protein (c-di-GMP phosphodiesterase class II)